ncbi:MAG: hypothetical protein MUO82_10440 [Candidatus Thermoplasmatota archaeon]|nr:hypothetical protein [Candidatus Thermoplasmatota archaeon]
MKASIDNETDTKGHFKVNVTIWNNLNFDVNASIIVDMSDRSVVSSLLPMLKGYTIYNVGYWIGSVKKNNYKSTEISCIFPDKGFDKKNYIITVACAPFIDIGGNNFYGIYFYNLRWQIGVKPYYIINDNTSRVIQKVWYNLPIFYGMPATSGQIFNATIKSILYNGNTSGDILIDEITKNLLDQPLFLLLIVFLIGTPYTLMILLIYRNVRNTNRNTIRKKNR